MVAVRVAVTSGRYTRTDHANQRMGQRLVPLPDVLNALESGWHEKKKDVFDKQYQAWNYAVRGLTVNGEPLRVVVSFDESEMLIITVIRLVR
jgi:uncharacterized protein YukE